ncbi:hypothetical protein C1645_833262 [Glomus cerebriforme]|uniref:F-box domain-containing protein n=1 Tax=Glomus cerebriforme TaxID=658196 RepID=A0A397SE32_9GLOM|nr:hypothetical protein C1645_833262 [Glomus cerebriforme]
MPCQLPADCLNEIFEYLDDKKTLHSLLFVNRLCCKISIRILWRNFWKYRIVDIDLGRCLNILVACLPNESKELLLKNGIFISTPTSKPSLFNYPAFCKVLSINKICLIVNDVLEKIPITSLLSKKDRNYLIINEIIKMFITQSYSLKELTFYNDTYVIPNEISFICFSGAIDCLADLSELHCSSRLPSEFFYQLSKICHNIHSLSIYMKYNNYFPNEFKELISLQNNLKNLKLSTTHRGDWTDIIPALTKHSNTLTKLHLNSTYNNRTLPVSFVALFSNLQEIKISFTSTFGKIQFRDFGKLQYVTFPKLQYLSIPIECTMLVYIKNFLENNGKNLKGLCIVGLDHDRFLNLSIAKFCPILENFSTVFELDTLKTIFNSCQYLERIEIFYEEHFLGEKEVLETVARHSPKYFCELTTIYNKSHTKLLPEDLESFFISWKSRASKKSLILIIIRPFCIDSLETNEENMEIIRKYKNLGIIKKFETKIRECEDED